MLSGFDRLQLCIKWHAGQGNDRSFGSPRLRNELGELAEHFVVRKGLKRIDVFHTFYIARPFFPAPVGSQATN